MIFTELIRFLLPFWYDESGLENGVAPSRYSDAFLYCTDVADSFKCMNLQNEAYIISRKFLCNIICIYDRDRQQL